MATVRRVGPWAVRGLSALLRGEKRWGDAVTVKAAKEEEEDYNRFSKNLTEIKASKQYIVEAVKAAHPKSR
jgi:hypothetical protein